MDIHPIGRFQNTWHSIWGPDIHHRCQRDGIAVLQAVLTRVCGGSVAPKNGGFTNTKPGIWPQKYRFKLDLTNQNMDIRYFTPYGSKHFLRRYLTPQIIPQTSPNTS